MAVPVLLFAVGGFLLGGAWAMRNRSVVLAAALGLCAVVAVVSAFLRYP
ncbi:MAG: hypothetical protein H0V10_09985 [Geodermatophilaceae bacterium]|nr:hypothetical protein [Geodermatophilaceae bacterium]